MINLQNSLTLHGFFLVQQKGERQHPAQKQTHPNPCHRWRPRKVPTQPSTPGFISDALPCRSLGVMGLFLLTSKKKYKFCLSNQVTHLISHTSYKPSPGPSPWWQTPLRIFSLFFPRVLLWHIFQCFPHALISSIFKCKWMVQTDFLKVIWVLSLKVPKMRWN